MNGPLYRPLGLGDADWARLKARKAPLSPYEQWMVRSNLETIRSTGVSVAEQVAILRANGYERIAKAVEAQA